MEEALAAALATDLPLLVTGSFYLVGAVGNAIGVDAEPAPKRSL
jgi:hypothetical protein